MRPILSDSDAQKKRPPMLNSDSRPVKPAAMPAIGAFCAASSSVKPTSGNPISLPPKISCSIGEAMPITPMPADTFRHSTAPDQPELRRLVRIVEMHVVACEIIALAFAGGVQPSGRQPARRHAITEARRLIMNTK